MIKTRLFTAEKRKLRERGDFPPGHAAAPAPTAETVTNSQILDAICDLAQFLGRDMNARSDEPPQAANDDPPQIGAADAERIEEELRSMSQAIEETKSEIAALRPGQPQDDKLMAVTGELDAVVQATEQATNDILAAAERVDEPPKKSKKTRSRCSRRVTSRTSPASASPRS